MKYLQQKGKYEVALRLEDEGVVFNYKCGAYKKRGKVPYSEILESPTVITSEARGWRIATLFFGIAAAIAVPFLCIASGDHKNMISVINFWAAIAIVCGIKWNYEHAIIKNYGAKEIALYVLADKKPKTELFVSTMQKRKREYILNEYNRIKHEHNLQFAQDYIETLKTTNILSESFFDHLRCAGSA